MADERLVTLGDVSELKQQIRDQNSDIRTIRDTLSNIQIEMARSESKGAIKIAEILAADRVSMAKALAERDVALEQKTSKMTVQQGILWAAAGLIGSALITGMIAWALKHIP